MKGTLVNFAAILAGAGLGLILRMGISEGCKQTILQAMGLAVLFIGIKMCLASQNSMIGNASPCSRRPARVREKRARSPSSSWPVNVTWFW